MKETSLDKQSAGAPPAADHDVSRDAEQDPYREGALVLQRLVGNRATRALLGGADAGAAAGPGGMRLPPSLRAHMEARLGADFSRVRVHPRSPRAEAASALAFTEGEHVHVARGQWAPETPRGRAVLGHELWHVVQQRSGRVRATGAVGGAALNDDARLEAEADAMGARAAGGGVSLRAPGPAPAAPRAARGGVGAVIEVAAPPAGAGVVQRLVVAQIVPDPGRGIGVVGRVVIAGRPERVFGRSMGDHSTAFSVHVAAIRAALEGKPLAAAVTAMGRLADSMTELVGWAAMDALPVKHKAKLHDAWDALLDARTRAEKSDAALDLQEYVAAFLSFRELLPLSVIDVSAKAPALAGKGKGEGGYADVLRAHEIGEDQSEGALLAAILATFDASGVGLVAVELEDHLADRMAPALGTRDPFARANNYVQQHVDTVRTSFPRVFESFPALADRALKALRAAVGEAMQGWAREEEGVVSRQERFQERRRGKVQEDYDLALTNRRATRLQRDKQEELATIDTDLTDTRRKLDAIDSLKERLGVTSGRPVFTSDADDLAPMAEEVDRDAEADEDEEEEERRYPLAIQLVLSPDGTVRELRSAGRSPSPFGSQTMGAHTTAWSVHVERVRVALQGKTLAQAIGVLRDTLIPEARKRAGLLGAAFPANGVQVAGMKASLANLGGLLGSAPGSAAEAALLIQQCVSELLTFINYTPGSTLEAANTDGRGEGAKRSVLQAHELAGSESKADLRAAILGLLDLPEDLDKDRRTLLLQGHLHTIQMTYPKSYRDADLGSNLGVLLGAHARLDKGKKKKPAKRREPSEETTSGDDVGDVGDVGVVADIDFAAMAAGPQGDLVGLDGGILPAAQQTFVDAYRDDVRNSNAYLTEGEGHIIANALGLCVNVYRGQVPLGFERVENDGGGNCLIHSLVQIQNQRNGALPFMASGDQIRALRAQVADALAPADILALCAAAIMARIFGGQEPGLGPQVRALLGSNSVRKARMSFKPAPSPVSSSTSSGDKGADKAKGVANGGGNGAALIAIGAGVPLADYAVLHTGGAHYVMLRRAAPPIPSFGPVPSFGMPFG